MPVSYPRSRAAAAVEFEQKATWVGTSALNWPGLSANATHLQASSAGDTYTIIVPAVAGTRIVVDGIHVHHFGLTGSPYVNAIITLGALGSDDDIFVGIAGGVAARCGFNSPIALEAGKALVLYHVLGPDDNHPVVANISYHFEAA